MARGEFPSSKQDQFMVRFPDGMRDQIKEAAEENGRSMNAEIVARLETSLDPNAVSPDRLRFFEEMYKQNTDERADLIKTINNQDRLLHQIQRDHQSFVILAKALGEAFLAQGEKSDVLKVLAESLISFETDVSDPSDPSPNSPWEGLHVDPYDRD